MASRFTPLEGTNATGSDYKIGKCVNMRISRLQPDFLQRRLLPLCESLHVEIADASCFAIADTAQFETALMNLAVNSRDAMDSEGRLNIRVCKVGAIPPLRGQPDRAGRAGAANAGTG